MPYSLIGPDPITQLLATLNRPAAPDATAVANLPRFPAQRTIGARTVDAAPQMTGPLGALMSVGESMHNGIVARRQTGLKPEDYVQLALLAAPALGRLASLGKTATAAEPLATAIAGPEWAGAARAAAPEIAPVAARAIPGAEMQTLDAKSLTNLLSSGFANMPVSPESVVLPAGGAGRAGTTAAAVGRARRMVGEAKLRQLAKIEQAKRGGTSPESAMAAMEQVSRNVASGAVERPGLGVLADSVGTHAFNQWLREQEYKTASPSPSKAGPWDKREFDQWAAGEAPAATKTLYRVEANDLGNRGEGLKAHLTPEQWNKFVSERGRLFSDKPLEQYGHGVEGYTTYSVDLPADAAAKVARAHPDGFTEYLLDPKDVARKKPLKR